MIILLNNVEDNIKIIIGMLLALGLSLIIMVLSKYITKKKLNKEKITSYECGFEPFEDARSKFDVKFYIVAIMFIIFDLELLLLFPWALVLGFVGLNSYFIGICFILILVLGFGYELFSGVLDLETVKKESR